MAQRRRAQPRGAAALLLLLSAAVAVVQGLGPDSVIRAGTARLQDASGVQMAYSEGGNTTGNNTTDGNLGGGDAQPAVQLDGPAAAADRLLIEAADATAAADAAAAAAAATQAAATQLAASQAAAAAAAEVERVAALPQWMPSYDTSAYTQLPELSNVVAVHMVHIPGTEKYLYMERPSGWHPDGSRVIAGTFDLWTGKFTNLDSPDGLFCAGHTLMSNGSVVIVGGHVENAGYPSGIQSIRTFTDGQPSLYKVTNMLYPRWYPTITLMPNKQHIIMGGTQGVGAGTKSNTYYEIWDSENPGITVQRLVSPIYLSSVKQNYYPFNFVLPTGDMFNYCGRVGWIMDAFTGEYKLPIPSRPYSTVSKKSVYTTQYPYTGTAVMLALRPEENYDATIMIIGGADIQAAQDLTMLACSESISIKISMPKPWATRDNAYWFNGGWVTEQLAFPRVMPDSVLLPNGVVIVMSGAMRGLAGDSAAGGGSKASYPVFHAEMYDPYLPVGSRWSTLARSQIARLYHSTSALTTQGTILVSGCDRCGKIDTNDTEYSAPPVKAEYRNEVFYPPFWYDTVGKPVLMDWPNFITYGENFMVMYAGEIDPNVPVTGAALVAPSSTTHSFNQNQRVVMLEIEVSTEKNWITLIAPPSANHAPPQMYMLFLLNGYTYSSAVWITLDNAPPNLD
ncbi:hypothetical protein FOA52_001053 [Chlamydomonas sp. UWO 241]|nr:hypothetical protein FOA52_001053 [Chlamydomonas sp. UWO 241]